MYYKIVFFVSICVGIVPAAPKIAISSDIYKYT